MKKPISSAMGILMILIFIGLTETNAWFLKLDDKNALVLNQTNLFEIDYIEVKMEHKTKKNIFDSSILEGEWFYVGGNQFSQTIVNISNVNTESFYFEMLSFSGANMGELSGIAKIVENKAFFQDKELETKVTFILEDDVLTITGKNLFKYGGLGVSFHYGNYKKDYKMNRVNLVDLQILTQEQELGFKNLVGEDYEIFNDKFHLGFHTKDLDNLGAKVYEGGVRGLFTISEAIVMIVGEKQFIAATLDDGQVYYYTNIDEFRDVMPKTINKWRERFEAIPVIIKTSITQQLK